MAETTAAAPTFPAIAEGAETGAGAIARHFYDSVHPVFMPPGSMAACYGFGPFTAPISQLSRFSGHILINDMPRSPEAARLCRVLDRERLAATDDDVVPWAQARHDFGHDDATFYASLVNMPPIIERLQHTHLPWRLWVAWWRHPEPTPAEVVQRLAAMGVTVDQHRIWAIQHTGGPNLPYDTSTLHGVDDFVR